MTNQFKPTLFERIGGRDRIMVLVKNFYATVRTHPELGPIFERQVKDWPSHLENIADFWSTQTGGPALFRGGMGKHFNLGLKPEHFEAWLQQWEKSCCLQLPREEAAALTAVARGFGTRMVAALRSDFKFAP